MKHKVLLALLLLQTLLVFFGVIYLKNRINNGSPIVAKMQINANLDISHNKQRLYMDFWDEENIPMSEVTRSELIDVYYKKAYLVFDNVQNLDGYNDILYLSFEEPQEKELYIEVYASDKYREDDDSGVFNELQLRIEGRVTYKTTEDSIRKIREELSAINEGEIDTPLEVGASLIVDKKIVYINNVIVNGVTY